MQGARTIPAAREGCKAHSARLDAASGTRRRTAHLTPVLSLDLIQTVAFAGVVLFGGYGIRRAAPVLARHNIPAPVIGGLLVAGVLGFAASRGLTLVTFDTTLQAPLMIAFF